MALEWLFAYINKNEPTYKSSITTTTITKKDSEDNKPDNDDNKEDFENIKRREQLKKIILVDSNIFYNNLLNILTSNKTPLYDYDDINIRKAQALLHKINEIIRLVKYVNIENILFSTHTFSNEYLISDDDIKTLISMAEKDRSTDFVFRIIQFTPNHGEDMTDIIKGFKAAATMIAGTDNPQQ